MLRTKLIRHRDESGMKTRAYGAYEDELRDMVYAHALVQAINEIGVTKEGMYAECCVARDTQSFLFERAAEIMRGFGYE